MIFRDFRSPEIAGVSTSRAITAAPLAQARVAGAADSRAYNGRYELTGVNYRAGSVTDYRTFGGGYSHTFTYDDNFNRTAASSADPFANDATISDSYTTNDANEYTQITRNSSNQNPAHDKNGNMTSLPTRPATGAAAGTNVSTAITFDAFNRPFTAQAGGNGVQDYRYDALGRRIAAMELSGGNILAGRRFIWDGWSVATERLLSGTTGNCDSLLERCYVEGASLDEHLFAAIDGDTDGNLGTNLNVPVSAGTTNTNDYEYYYLQNRLGSVMGLLDATDDRYMLEYYRYTVYGEATVLPLYDTGLNSIEDTPTDLTDNNSAMLATRTGGGGDPTSGRASTFNNQYTFTGRYLDAETGLHYYRFRYYESRTGRFISRDPAETPWENLYSYSNNSSTYFTDPMGLGPCEDLLGSKYMEQLKARLAAGAGAKNLREAQDYLLSYEQANSQAHADAINACLRELADLYYEYVHVSGYGNRNDTRHGVNSVYAGPHIRWESGHGITDHPYTPLSSAAQPVEPQDVSIGGGGVPGWISGGAYYPGNVDDFRDLIARLAANGPIRRIHIVAHGGMEPVGKAIYGATKLGASTGMILMGKDHVNIDALRHILRGKMTRPCEIVISACKIGNQENRDSLQRLANDTGCTVTATVGISFVTGLPWSPRGYAKFTPEK